MKIQVLFFGITTDLVDASQLEIIVQENIYVKDFKAVLKNQYAQLKNIESYAIAVNEEYASDVVVLKPGDVVAVIPPVSGG